MFCLYLSLDSRAGLSPHRFCKDNKNINNTPLRGVEKSPDGLLCIKIRAVARFLVKKYYLREN